MADEDLNNCEQLSLIPLGKMYYSISEVCRATNLEPHVLRYWESEFSMLRPKKNRGGKRAYKDKDIEIICRIKRLLYEEKYTITGAKQKLAEERQAEDIAPKRSRSKSETQETPLTPQEEISPSEISSPQLQSIPSDLICSLRKELEEVLALLK